MEIQKAAERFTDFPKRYTVVNKANIFQAIIVTDVTKELRRSEFESLDLYFKNGYTNIVTVLPNRELRDFSNKIGKSV